jgi:hypothetical protein
MVLRVFRASGHMLVALVAGLIGAAVVLVGHHSPVEPVNQPFHGVWHAHVLPYVGGPAVPAIDVSRAPSPAADP